MLQVQFQQRLQSMLMRMPMGPIVAGPGSAGRPPSGMRSTRSSKMPPPSQGRPPQAAPAAAPGSKRPQPEMSIKVDATGSSKATSPAMQPDLGPISAEALMLLDENSRMEALGERLFVRVQALEPEHAPKITGMLLELPPLEAHALLENQQLLNSKVHEAVGIITGQ